MAKKRPTAERPDPTTPEPTEPEQPQQPEPAGDPAPEQPPEEAPPADPAPEEQTAGEDRPDEPEPGPLSQLQEALEALLDYDQMTEIRLALVSRAGELEKHTKKGSDLGVREEDARRRLRIIQGSDTRFGLCRIFAERPVTEQRDVFFDREKPNGRPDGHVDEFEEPGVAFDPLTGEDLSEQREAAALADETRTAVGGSPTLLEEGIMAAASAGA